MSSTNPFLNDLYVSTPIQQPNYQKQIDDLKMALEFARMEVKQKNEQISRLEMDKLEGRRVFHELNERFGKVFANSKKVYDNYEELRRRSPSQEQAETNHDDLVKARELNLKMMAQVSDLNRKLEILYKQINANRQPNADFTRPPPGFMFQ